MHWGLHFHLFSLPWGLHFHLFSLPLGFSLHWGLHFHCPWGFNYPRGLHFHLFSFPWGSTLQCPTYSCGLLNCHKLSHSGVCRSLQESCRLCQSQFLNTT